MLTCLFICVFLDSSRKRQEKREKTTLNTKPTNQYVHIITLLTSIDTYYVLLHTSICFVTFITNRVQANISSSWPYLHVSMSKITSNFGWLFLLSMESKCLVSVLRVRACFPSSPVRPLCSWTCMPGFSGFLENRRPHIF